jgi:hypothetical protein
MPRAGWLDTTRAMDATLQAIRQYRSGIQYATCLIQHNIDVTVSPGLNGVPEYKANHNAQRTNPEGFTACDAQRHSGSRPVAGDDAPVSSASHSHPLAPDPQSTRTVHWASAAGRLPPACLHHGDPRRGTSRCVSSRRDGVTRRPPAAQPIIAAAAVALLSSAARPCSAGGCCGPSARSPRRPGLGEGNLALRVPAQGATSWLSSPAQPHGRLFNTPRRK